jgi:hypothetical protein
MNYTIMIMQVVGFDEVGGEFFKEMLLFGTLQPTVSSRLGDQVQYNDRSLTVEACRDGDSFFKEKERLEVNEIQKGKVEMIWVSILLKFPPMFWGQFTNHN